MNELVSDKQTDGDVIPGFNIRDWLEYTLYVVLILMVLASLCFDVVELL